MNTSVTNKLPIAVLISGSGSNLQAIIDAAQNDLPVEIRAVISNKADAYGLLLAQQAGIQTHVVNHQGRADRASYDRELIRLIEASGARLVVLAGFMRILGDGFVQHYEGRLLNIHPSLLPRYRGLDTHARALAAGDREHGATVHFVTTELDAGPIITQAKVPVEAGDTVESLAARVLAQEHLIYPEAIRWYANGRLKLANNLALLDGQPVKL
ncbi:MAG: phosphoribosylglycinamide formyltransferase [Thiohalomonadaceae bacterium]